MECYGKSRCGWKECTPDVMSLKNKFLKTLQQKKRALEPADQIINC